MASPRQRRKVKRVMHEFKEGELKAGRGRRGKVESRRQAIAIAMSEVGTVAPARQAQDGEEDDRQAHASGQQERALRRRGA